jgi:hypothetical protein
LPAAFVTLPLLVILTASGGHRAVTQTKSLPPALARIVEQLEAGTGPSTREIVAAGAVPNSAAILIERMAGWTPPARVTALGVLADLGAPLVQLGANFPPTPGPMVDDPLVIRELVARLRDPVRDVRSAAASLLVDRVSDGLVRDHSAEIIAAIAKQPSTDGATLLLGKTGAAAAEKLLRGEPRLRDAAALETQAALGRLGDRQAETSLIDACEKERDPGKRAQLLSWIGYMATVHAVLFLAREVRTPETYVWVMSARRSMRIHVIEALHRAFPAERTFWPPPFKPDGDAYYGAVEAWITKNLGVTWPQPRPPFLYEEDAPAAPPRR